MEPVRNEICIDAEEKIVTRDISDEIRQQFYIGEVQLIDGKLYFYGYKRNCPKQKDQMPWRMSNLFPSEMNKEK